MAPYYSSTKLMIISNSKSVFDHPSRDSPVTCNDTSGAVFPFQVIVMERTRQRLWSQWEVCYSWPLFFFCSFTSSYGFFSEVWSKDINSFIGCTDIIHSDSDLGYLSLSLKKVDLNKWVANDSAPHRRQKCEFSLFNKIT